MIYALAVILALVGTVLLMVLVTPQKRYAGLNTFFKALADIFNFKGLLLEYIIKAVYIFETLLCIVGGFFLLFEEPAAGLLTMILGPIALRIIFEFTMMFILLVKNVIQMNSKMPGKGDDPFDVSVPERPNMVFCSQCGTQYDANKGGCPKGCKE